MSHQPNADVDKHPDGANALTALNVQNGTG